MFSTARPEKDTLALIEPRIASIHTLDDMPQDGIWQSVIIARTVTQWSKVTNSALLQVGNPSDRNIILKPNTIVGTITPVTAISPRTASAVTQNCSESSQARIDLTAALDESFKNTTFDDQQRAQIINLCTEYRSVFTLNQKELGKCTIAEAEFPLQKDTKPVDRHPYRTNPRAQEVIDKCVDDMEEIDIIEKRPSEWGSPVCIVAKADGSPRFCVDYRATINRFLVRETWPMPDIESHIDTVGGANFITVCDVQSAYWQIPIAPKDRHKTAFVTSKGKYVFKVLPFGIANAPWIFQRVMSLAFANFGQPSGLLVYMDDLIACSATWEAHLKLLEDMFRALQTAGLTLKPAKIHVGPKEVQYLGHVLSADGIRMGEDRIKTIVDLKTPTAIKELRSVLGTVNFVRKFIPNLATIIEPLVALTRKSVANLKTLRNIWGPAQDAAFIKVKELLTSAPVLHFPRFHKPFIIHVDASDCGVGAFLAQKDDNGELAIIAYFSKRFTSSQQHYSATQKECLAVVLAVTHWRPYIWGRHFVCITDQSALRYLYSMQDTSNMLTRWAIALQSYDFTVEHKPGKLNIIPDTLSRLFSFEHSEMRVAPHLAPICRNVPDNPALHGPHRLRPYQVNSHNLDEIQPVESDRELFTSATDVFMSIDPEKLRQAQQAEFGPYFEYLCDPKKRPPSKESRTSMSYYSENGGLLYRSYLPGHLRKRSTFRDQLVIPSACIPMVLHACHDHAMSGGHLAYKHTFDKVRDRFWWPTLHRDVKTWCQDCQACQRRKTPHRGPKLPTGHLPVDRPFQRVSIDLVEYKTESVSPTGLKCSYALTIIDHLTRFSVLVALPDKKEQTIAKALVERVFGIFGPPETLHSDQGPEFENKVVKQLQDVFGYKKTKTTPYRPQGNSVSERMHSTLHAMLSMYSNIAQNNWAEVLPFIQLAHNTSFSSTMHETPFFLMFGRQARLPIDIIFGIPHVGKSATTEEFAHATRENLQIAFELARRNLSERIEKQKADNSKLPPIPEFTPGQKVLIYKPHHSTDGPNPKLIQPWRGPYIICSKLSPVVYRIRHPDDTKQVSVHLAHIKSYRPRQSAPAPDFHKLEGLFLGKTLPTPALEESETVPPHIGIYQVAEVVGHRRGQGRHSPHNYIYRLRLKGFGPEADLEYRAHQVQQCQELIAAYRAQHQLETITPPPCNKRKHPASNDGNSPGSDTAPKNGSPLENEPAIRKRPCNKRKHRTSTNDNPLGSDTPPEDGSPLESEPAIRKRPCHKQKHRASKDGNPLGSDSAPKDGSPLEREPLTRKRKPRSGSNKEKNNPKRRK